MKTKHLPGLLFPVFFCLVFLLLSACSEKDSENELIPERDAGESLAGTFAINTGGVLDQISDLCEFLVDDTTKVAQALSGKYPSRYYSMHKTYDNDLKLWTITINKSRGSLTDLPYAEIERTFTLQYKNLANEPQKWYVTEGDTAHTVKFKIRQGYCHYYTRRIAHNLDSLACDWTISSANQPNVVINGTYYKAGVDTISGWNRIRNSHHVMNMYLNGLVAPRGYHANLYAAVSGSVTGSYQSQVQFTYGNGYGETNVNRDFELLIGGGRADIEVGTKDYTADLFIGELLD